MGLTQGNPFVAGVVISTVISICLACPGEAQPQNLNNADSSIKLKPMLPNPANNTQDELSAFDKLEDKETVLVNPEKIIVKPPMLKALIKLEQPVSPLHVDADSHKDITLGDVLKTALRNNLDIKISEDMTEYSKWRVFEHYASFLPDVANTFSLQALRGLVASPAGAIINLNSPYITQGSAFNWNLFQGGSRIYNTIRARHLRKASQAKLQGTVNDVLLQATQLYYNLVEQDALLQIRVKAVEESKAILKLNEDLFTEGVATKLDVLQSRTQLSRDRQLLVSQQINRRTAAVDLATALYLNPAVDLNISNRTVQKIRLISNDTRISKLVSLALAERPELPHKEERRQAALQLAKVHRAALLPNLSFSGAVAATGADIARGAGGQQIPLSSVTAAGSTVTPTITSGASTPLTQGFGNRKTFDMRALFVLGMDVNWQLGGLGAVDAAKIKKAQYLARIAQLEYNKQLAQIYKEVRNSYNHAIDTETLVKETTTEVNSSEESLRIAVLRLKEGLGVQTDVIVAQRDYTQALINKAKAIIDYNVSQAQILHSTGAISFNTLTRGLKP